MIFNNQELKTKTDIRSLSFEEIQQFLKSINEKSFRAKQIYEWLWCKSARSFENMVNVPQKLKLVLSDNFDFRTAVIEQNLKSPDGTIKFVFKLYDNNKIEGVLIPSGKRMTACVSTQCGCPIGCSFCATGINGFTRNLSYAEIYDQVFLISESAKKEYNQKLSNIVYMGMGEPFLNYENTINSIIKFTSPNGLSMSPQRITISTAGIPEKIIKFAKDKTNVNLAVSLHSAIDFKRDLIMPLNKKYTVKDLSKSLIKYYLITKNRITIEYLLLNDFNDSINDAKELAVFCKSFPVKINLIEYNPTASSDFLKSEPDKMNEFKKYLESKNLTVNIRKSKGEKIFAACGQLSCKK